VAVLQKTSFMIFIPFSTLMPHNPYVPASTLNTSLAYTHISYVCMFTYSSRTDKPVCPILGLLMPWSEEEILELRTLKKFESQWGKLL
jgi:hypothetical protein